MNHYYEFDQFINILFDNTQISDDEIRKHAEFLKNELKKNFY